MFEAKDSDKMKYEIKILHLDFFFYSIKMTQLHKMFNFQQKF